MHILATCKLKKLAARQASWKPSLKLYVSQSPQQQQQQCQSQFHIVGKTNYIRTIKDDCRQ